MYTNGGAGGERQTTTTTDDDNVRPLLVRPLLVRPRPTTTRRTNDDDKRHQPPLTTAHRPRPLQRPHRAHHDDHHYTTTHVHVALQRRWRSRSGSRHSLFALPTLCRTRCHRHCQLSVPSICLNNSYAEQLPSTLPTFGTHHLLEQLLCRTVAIDIANSRSLPFALPTRMPTSLPTRCADRVARIIMTCQRQRRPR
jgi:hypothetical protein